MITAREAREKAEALQKAKLNKSRTLPELEKLEGEIMLAVTYGRTKLMFNQSLNAESIRYLEDCGYSVELTEQYGTHIIGW